MNKIAVIEFNSMRTSITHILFIIQKYTITSKTVETTL